MHSIAADLPTTVDGDARLSLLRFDIDEVRFAIAALQAREVVRAVAITPLPGAPRVVEGVINVRGESIPVLDLRCRFQLPAAEVSPAELFVIAWTGARTAAMRVTRVNDLITVDQGDIDDPRELTRGADHIAGVIRMPDGLVLLHDLESFLDAAEEATLDTALAQQVEQGGAT